jgi:hypothetical protein
VFDRNKSVVFCLDFRLSSSLRSERRHGTRWKRRLHVAMMTTRTHHVDGQYCWRALPWSLNQLNQQYDNPFYIGVGQPSIGVDAACQRGADIAAVAASSKGVEANSWTCQPFRRPLVASSAFSSSYSASHQWPTSATDLIAVGVDGITVGMTKQQQQQVAATAANRIDSLPASILAAVNDSNKRMQVNRDAMAMKRCGGGTLDFTGCPRTASEFGRCLQQQQSPTVIDSMSICQPSVADQMRMHSPVPQQRMSAASETSPSPRHSLCSDVEIGTVTSSPSSFTQSVSTR